MTDKTTLQRAQAAWIHAEMREEKKDGNAYYRSLTEQSKQDAAILAQLATAEALTRIAEVLETMLEADQQ